MRVRVPSPAFLIPGIHLFHKPAGPSSFSLVQAMRAGVPPRVRVCHGGALDPFAHGLMLLLVGPATRLFDHLHAVPKIYEADVRWGVETDNGDPLGRAVFEGDASALTPSRLDEALAGLVGWRDQVPPATSNKRVGGERAYAKAHRGEAVDLPPSRVYLHGAAWIGHDLPRQSRLRIVVRGGYYVRSLARDLGRTLGCGAHLATLHRTSIGPWDDPGPAQTRSVAGRALLPWAASRVLSDQEVGELRQERPIAATKLIEPEWRLPQGFPDPDAPVRAFHRDRLAFLLRPDPLTAADRLLAFTAFPGGL